MWWAQLAQQMNTPKKSWSLAIAQMPRAYRCVNRSMSAVKPCTSDLTRGMPQRLRVV